MIFGKTKLEFKVGIFVFIGIALLSIFVLSIGKVRTWTSGYIVNFVFNFVNGVKVGAPVRFAGVDSGEVKRINLVFVPQEQRTKAEVICWLKKDVRIPLDSTIWVNTLGLLGEKYIEIMPGNDYVHCLAKNESFVGLDPIPMHEVARQAMNIVDNLNKGIINIKDAKGGTIGRFLYDDTVYKNIEAFTDDIRKHPWKLLIKTKEKK